MWSSFSLAFGIAAWVGKMANNRVASALRAPDSQKRCAFARGSFAESAIVVKTSVAFVCILALVGVAHADQSLVKGQLTIDSTGVGQIAECSPCRTSSEI